MMIDDISYASLTQIDPRYRILFLSHAAAHLQAFLLQCISLTTADKQREMYSLHIKYFIQSRDLCSYLCYFLFGSYHLVDCINHTNAEGDC
jgi:hypothetical protein